MSAALEGDIRATEKCWGLFGVNIIFINDLLMQRLLGAISL